jgi:hypothetical protein
MTYAIRINFITLINRNQIAVLLRICDKFYKTHTEIPLLYNKLYVLCTGTAQSVWRLATEWTAEESEFESGKSETFLFFTSPRPIQGPTQTPIQWVRGALFPSVKQSGPEADH